MFPLDKSAYTTEDILSLWKTDDVIVREVDVRIIQWSAGEGGRASRGAAVGEFDHETDVVGFESAGVIDAETAAAAVDTEGMADMG